MKHWYDGISEYIRDINADYSILVNGRWGEGKTFFFQNLFSEKIKRDIKILLVSVAGKQDVNVIGSDIAIKYCFIDSGHSNMVQTVLSNPEFVEVATDLSNSLLSHKDFRVTRNTMGIVKKLGTNFINHKMQNDLTKVVLVVDDLERYEGKYSELFSFIQTHYVEKKTPVIYVGNESEISLEKKDDYRKHKEKYIRYTYKFVPDLIEAMNQIFRERIKNGEIVFNDESFLDISKWLHDKRLTNLRTIIRAVEYLKKFNTDCLKEKSKINFFLLLILHIEALSSYKNIQEKSYQDDSIKHDKSEYNDNKRYKEFLESIGFKMDMAYILVAKAYHLDYFPFQQIIADLFNTGTLDNDEANSMLSDLYPESNEYVESLENLVNFEMSEEDYVIEQVKKTLEGIEKRVLPYSNLRAAGNRINFISNYIDDIKDLNYKKIIFAALSDADYPGYIEYYESRQSSIRKSNVTSDFDKELVELIGKIKKEYIWKKEGTGFRVLFKEINNKYVDDFQDYENDFFTLICKYDLLGELENLNNRGLVIIEAESHRLSQSIERVQIPLSEEQYKSVKTVKETLESIPDSESKMRNNIRSEVIISLEHLLEKSQKAERITKL